MTASEQPSVTLHTTWRHLVASAIGSGLVAAGGTYGVVSAGFNVVTTALFVVGWALVAVVLFDVPLAATFTAEGVRRRMLLRRQFLGWRPGDVLTRTRPSVVRTEERLRQGGLVLRRGRRRYMLVDRAESRDEFHALLRIVEVDDTPGDDVDLSGLATPPEDAPPTWLYRRRDWRPDAGAGR